MSEFSKIFEKYIKRKKISSATLGKYCGLDQKSVFNILKGSGKLPEEKTVHKMISYMQLTPSEKKEMFIAYEITRIGREKYYMRKQVQNLIEEFPECRQMETGNIEVKISSAVGESNENSCIPLYNQTEVNQYLHYMCIREAKKQRNSQIRLVMQPEYKFLFDLLLSLKNINENLEIEHVICIDKVEKMSGNMEFYNLRYLKNILPLYINAVKYHVFYIEEDLQSYKEGFQGFSNLFLTEDYVLVCTADFQKGMVYHSPEIQEYFKQRYNTYKAQSRKLFHVIDDVQKQINNLGNMGWDKRLSYAMQPEPCLISLMTPELVEKVIYKELPGRDILVPRFDAFIKEAHARVQRGINIFYCTKEGLDHFVSEGRLPEAPEEIYRPFQSEEKTELMEAALPLCRKGYFRFLKPPLDHLSANLHLCMNEKEGYLLFQNINGQNIYLVFHDKKLKLAFWDFLSNLGEENLYTGEETAEYFEETIKKIKRKQIKGGDSL